MTESAEINLDIVLILFDSEILEHYHKNKTTPIIIGGERKTYMSNLNIIPYYEGSKEWVLLHKIKLKKFVGI